RPEHPGRVVHIFPKARPKDARLSCLAKFPPGKNEHALRIACPILDVTTLGEASRIRIWDHRKSIKSGERGIARERSFATFLSSGSGVTLIESIAMSSKLTGVRLCSCMLSKTKGNDVASRREGRSLI